MSRWWGIVSTFYLVAAPILLLTGYHMLWDSRDPEAVNPILYVVALLGPLGFLVPVLVAVLIAFLDRIWF